MTPEQRKIHDNYPQLVGGLVTWASRVLALPVDELCEVLDRIEKAGGFHVVPGRPPGIVTDEHVDQHRRLLDMLGRWRSEYKAFVDEIEAGVTSPAVAEQAAATGRSVVTAVEAAGD